MEQLIHSVSSYMDTWVFFVDLGLAWDFVCVCVCTLQKPPALVQFLCLFYCIVPVKKGSMVIYYRVNVSV